MKMVKRDWLILAFFIAVMFCIIVHAALWNGVATGNLDGSYVFFSIVNMLVEAYGFWLIYRQHLKKE